MPRASATLHGTAPVIAATGAAGKVTLLVRGLLVALPACSDVLLGLFVTVLLTVYSDEHKFI